MPDEVVVMRTNYDVDREDDAPIDASRMRDKIEEAIEIVSRYGWKIKIITSPHRFKKSG